MDGRIAKAPCGGQVAEPSPVDRRKQGLKRSIVTVAALLRQLLAGRRQERPAADGAPREYLARLAEAFEQAGLPVRPPVGRGGVVVAGWWSR